jgi:hypothetical protein
MDAQTMLMLEGLGLVVVVAFILAVFAVLAWQSWRKDRAQRVNRPVQAKVVKTASRREENPFNLPDDWPHAIVVTTCFETAGRSFTIERQYRTEEQAAAFASLHAVGTSHEVIPSLDRGKAFLPEDFERPGTPFKDSTIGEWLITVVLLIALLFTISFQILAPR